MISKKRYEQLLKQSKEANSKNDYSKMIMGGSKEYDQMKEYERNALCKHPDIASDGGGDYCKQCGKRWNR